MVSDSVVLRAPFACNVDWMRRCAKLMLLSQRLMHNSSQGFIHLIFVPVNGWIAW